MRTWFRVSALLVAFLLVTAVPVFSAGQQEEALDLQPFDPDREYTISIGTYGLEEEYQRVAETDEFQEKFPNVTLEFESADFDGHHERLTTVIAAGEPTNHIESVEIEYIAQFVEGGGLTDLAQEPFNGFEAGDDLADFAMANATTTDGQLVAMPVDIAPAVLFYREELVEEAGVTEEEIQNISDWDDFLEIAEAVTRDTTGDGETDQFALPTAGEVADVPLHGAKGGWFDDEGNPLAPRDDYIEALELVQEVREAGVDADLGAWSEQWVQSFSDGTVAMTTNGAWFGGALQTWIAPDVEDWRVARLPEYASMGGTFLAIPEEVPDDEKLAAWEVLKYLTTSENAQLTVFEMGDVFPALTTVYDDPIMTEEVDYYGGQRVREIYSEVALEHPDLEASQYDATIAGIWGTTVTSVIEGDLTVEEAYEQAVEQILATM